MEYNTTKRGGHNIYRILEKEITEDINLLQFGRIDTQSVTMVISAYVERRQRINSFHDTYCILNEQQSKNLLDLNDKAMLMAMAILNFVDNERRELK